MFHCRFFLEVEMNPVKVIYFINDSCANAEELELANEINGRVCFRNARFILNTGCVEECDFVFGNIPDTYKHIPVYGKAKVSESKQIELAPKEKFNQTWQPNK